MPTQTPTPSPTPEPSKQLETALRHQINGEYEQAIYAFTAVLDGQPTLEQARQARYHLAQTYQSLRQYPSAAAAWEDFVAAFPDDARIPQAHLMAGRAHHDANDCTQAVPHYQAYLTSDPILADMVQEWIGDCLAAGGRLQEAIVAYQQALESSQDRGVQVSLREKIAGIHLAQENYEQAVAQYDAILDIARIGTYRAKIEYLAGQALTAAGQTEAAYARYRRAVERYPEAEHAYLSLVELVDAGIAVDELQRGMVDYYAGDAYPDANGAAIMAFDRYLASEPADQADKALFHKALAQRAYEQPEGALETLEALIVGYPESDWQPRAWLEKGSTLAAMGDNDGAVKTYEDLAAFFPSAEQATEAIWRAAETRIRDGDFSQAAAHYENLQASFPASEDADEALWRAGLAYYRDGDADAAVAVWRALLEKYPKSAYRPKTLYWLGKLKAEPVEEGADTYWDQLLADHPYSYYFLRVNQVQAGEALTTSGLITAAVAPPLWDPSQVEAEVLPWLQSWTQVPTATSLLSLPPEITGRLDFQRGEALLDVGLRREALSAFDGPRSAAWDDPVTLAQIAIYYREAGLIGLAARSALRLASLWPDGNVLNTPETLRRLAYPLAYADLLSAEASEYELDPLLLAALVRQESLFEPVAESYAGARGLGQVMPATGQGIANNLGMQGFDLDDLYRPSVSVKFGAYYLAVQLGRFDDHLLVALAAYNGGPGNTLRWLEAGGEDFDLFVEVITAAQSRLYLQRVYQHYLVYEDLYRNSGPDDQQ
jgi:soluble lytic murein transglycosylase